MSITIKLSITLSGRDIVALMRKHKVTIRELKKRSGFTMTYIRQRRETGISDTNAARDWIQLITGKDPWAFGGHHGPSD